jgi:DNA-binding transcriptional ArsR family regulator
MDGEQSGPLSMHLRSLLVLLADGADSTGRGSRMSVATLARKLTTTERTVMRAMADLYELGLVRDGDQQLVAHYRLDRRPIVRDLALARVALPEDGVTDVSSRPEQAPQPVDKRPRGDKSGSHGVTDVSPNPTTNPTTPTHLSLEGDTSARVSLAHAVPKEPGAPVRQLGLTDRECPTCGAVVNRSHRCRKSAMDPDPPPPDNVTRLPVEVLPGQYPLPIPVPNCEGRSPCTWCGRVVHVNTDGVCLRCLVDVTRVGPHREQDGAS